MKYLFQFCIVAALALFFIPQAIAGSKVEALNAREVQKLLNDHTMTITRASSKKKKVKAKKFKAYVSNMGTIRTMHPEGGSDIYNWSVSQDGYFCMKNSMKENNKGKTCGYFLKEGGSSFKLYKLKGVKVKKGRVVSASKRTLVLTFSQRLEGNKL